MPLVIGVDSSTQSTKVEVRDADSGALVASGQATHPVGPMATARSEQHPSSWWVALRAACREAATGAPARRWSPADIAAISVAGQQHGLVVLDGAGDVIRPAKLWNDTESAPQAAALLDRLDARGWARAVGSVPVAAFTIAKLAWLADAEPGSFARVRTLLLPHDWLTAQLVGHVTAGRTGRFTTDRGDASGSGYWSPGEGRWRTDLLDDVAESPHPGGWAATLPIVLGPIEAAGTLSSAAVTELGVGTTATVVGPGTGDNMGAALGIGLVPGDVAISLGTSGTVYAVSPAVTADATGSVAGFADATGRFLPLVCTLNATLVTEAMARLLGTDIDTLDAMAAGVPVGAGGVVLVPYLAGERTPNRPDATGGLTGLRTDTTREQLARAAFEGVTCGLLDGLDALAAADVDVERGRLLLVGGGARSRSYRGCIADLAQREVCIPAGTEHVATGACVQAAAVLANRAPGDVIGSWALGRSEVIEPDTTIDPAPIRARYAKARR